MALMSPILDHYSHTGVTQENDKIHPYLLSILYQPWRTRAVKVTVLLLSATFFWLSAIHTRSWSEVAVCIWCNYTKQVLPQSNSPDKFLGRY